MVRVLVIERSRERRDWMGELLLRHGCEVFALGDADTALRLARGIAPAWVVADWSAGDPRARHLRSACPRAGLIGFGQVLGHLGYRDPASLPGYASAPPQVDERRLQALGHV